jgi:hypothetical protein
MGSPGRVSYFNYCLKTPSKVGSLSHDGATLVVVGVHARIFAVLLLLASHSDFNRALVVFRLLLVLS